MPTLIDIEHISKHFGEIKSVDDLSFSVNEGEVYGFLGQNGAGKSTTIRILLSLIKPTSGKIKLFGMDLMKHRSRILRQVGAIIEKPDLYGYLTALQNIQMMAKLSGVQVPESRLMQQLERVGISDRAHSKVRAFSQGMKQRLGIACALVHDPKLVVLDEPTNGLDPQGIADMRNLIMHLSREEGKTIFVSSHLLSEIEIIADSMLIIDKGRKMAEGKVSQLLNPADTLISIETADGAKTKSVLEQSQWSKFLQNGPGIILKMDKKEVPQLVRFLTQHGIEIFSVQPRHSLEDYFLSLTTSNQHVAAYQN